MKKSLLLFLFCLLLFNLKAEYNGYYFKLKLTLANTKEVTAYTYKADAYLNHDSLNSTNYLKRVLNEYDKNETRFTFFKQLISYQFLVNPEEKQTNIIYTTIDKDFVLLTNIKSIVIEKMIEQSYDVGIFSDLSLADSNWMKQTPIQHLSIGGYLNSYDLFIHQNSKKIVKILTELKLLMEENELQWKEFDENSLNQVLGEEELAKKREELEKIDDKIYQILLKIKREKVVIIGYYSC